MTTQLDLIAERSHWCSTHAQTVLDKMRGRDSWSVDDVHGLEPEPDNPNHFGVLVNTLCKAGKIKHVGFKKSTRPAANGRWVQTWVVKE